MSSWIISTLMALNFSGRVSVRLAWAPNGRETMRVAGGVSVIDMMKTPIHKSNIQFKFHILKMPYRWSGSGAPRARAGRGPTRPSCPRIDDAVVPKVQLS